MNSIALGISLLIVSAVLAKLGCGALKRDKQERQGEIEYDSEGIDYGSTAIMCFVVLVFTLGAGFYQTFVGVAGFLFH